MIRDAARRFLLVVAVALAGPVASAQPLVANDYSVDIVDLPVLGSARAVGLGGAFASAGQGITAIGWNPAAAGTRASFERDWFEWEVGLGAIFPTNASSTRFFGATSDAGVRTDSFSYFDAGLRFQFGPAGVSLLARPRIFSSDGLDFLSMIGHGDLAWSLFDGDVVVGVGARFVALQIKQGQTTLLGISGTGAEIGVTYAPEALPFRVAAVVRSTIEASKVEGSAIAGYATPASVVAPWELTLSGTFGFGEAPLNDHPRRPLRRRDRQIHARLAARTRRAIEDASSSIPSGDAAEDVESVDLESRPELVEPAPRRPRYGLVTADLLIQGPVHDAVGIDGFITQTRRTWGRHATASPRVGIEGEPWRDRMKLRGGMYLEADRSSLASPRLHFTHGFDFRVFTWDFLGLFDEPIGVQVTWTADFAEKYVSVGVGVGIWH